MKSGVLRLTDESGKVYHWTFGKVGNHWRMKDHEGYERVLETTWLDSVPRIRMIAENYGLSTDVS